MISREVDFCNHRSPDLSMHHPKCTPLFCLNASSGANSTFYRIAFSKGSIFIWLVWCLEGVFSIFSLDDYVSVCWFIFVVFTVWNMETPILPDRLHFEAFSSSNIFGMCKLVCIFVSKMKSLNLGAGWSVFEVNAENHSDWGKTILFWEEVVYHRSRKVHAWRHAIISESKQLCQICVGDSHNNNGLSIPCTSISFSTSLSSLKCTDEDPFQGIDVIVTQLEIFL